MTRSNFISDRKQFDIALLEKLGYQQGQIVNYFDKYYLSVRYTYDFNKQ